MEHACPDSKSLFSLTQIIQQMNEESSKKIYSHEQSTKTFMAGDTLPRKKRLERSHSEEQMYLYKQHGKLYNQIGNMQVHDRIHSREKP